MKHPHLRLYLHNRSATNRLRYRNRRYRWIDRTQHHARHSAVTFRKAVRILDQVVRVFGSIYVVQPEKTFWEDSRYTIFIEVGWGRSSLPWIVDTCVEFSKHLHPHRIYLMKMLRPKVLMQPTIPSSRMSRASFLKVTLWFQSTPNDPIWSWMALYGINNFDCFTRQVWWANTQEVEIQREIHPLMTDKWQKKCSSYVTQLKTQLTQLTQSILHK